ncbi:hypothetical protein QFC19_000048 [Naganishia cerealis]|uniref:Uncharacterized protein n=1 Tax=Naganishia cerealis TaxID=610337 RepID=A0ACC2WRD6_9TREE|nr:hypothetical protein QFC19_000048 [Naganishia cerealis]
MLGDNFMDDLTRDGFVVVRNVLPVTEAQKYAQKAEDWLEGFSLGYKRDDPATWKRENLPGNKRQVLYPPQSFKSCQSDIDVFFFSGIISNFSIAHAQWVWDLKTDPRWVELFEKIWGTKELLVSFDGANLSVPLVQEHRDAPWPHTDQSPHKPDLFCIQSLINLLPNTEVDGGLWVMKGSAALFPELIEAFDLRSQFSGRDFLRYKAEHVEWLEARGCTWEHPNLDPGDVIFWDSRTAHWAASPETGRPRIAVYKRLTGVITPAVRSMADACYKPAKEIAPDQLALKQEAFKKGYCTTHDPITGIAKGSQQEADGNVLFPFGKPVLDERVLRYAGMLPY